MNFKLISMIFLTWLLSACALFGPNAPHAYIKVQSAKYLNPDINGNPSPIVLTIYELKNAFKFNQASYDALINNSAAVLGSDLIDQQTVEIRPGSYQTVIQIFSPNTHYLGLVAAYRNIGQAAWHKCIPVSADAQSTTIHLSLESQGLNVTLR